tara:strand:+ start:393 stop:596 length:204 start_codon:yes stop_codon:yes gene_type:complete
LQQVRTKFHEEFRIMPPAKPETDTLRDQLPIPTISDATVRLRYGATVLTGHDGKLVQMDVIERLRFS